MTRALDWLRPRATEPLLGQRGRSAEADHLRRDGLVVELWPGTLRALDLAHGAAGRSGAVTDLVPSGAVLAYQAAVWVHTGRHRPERLDVVLTGGRHRSTPDVRMHAERLPPLDVVRIGGRAVTSPGRTAVDIARRSRASDVPGLLAALSAVGLSPAEVRTALERATGMRGTPRARQLLAPVIGDAAWVG
jgi:hypothetical protein